MKQITYPRQAGKTAATEAVRELRWANRTILRRQWPVLHATPQEVTLTGTFLLRVRALIGGPLVVSWHLRGMSEEVLLDACLEFVRGAYGFVLPVGMAWPGEREHRDDAEFPLGSEHYYHLRTYLGTPPVEGTVRLFGRDLRVYRGHVCRLTPSEVMEKLVAVDLEGERRVEAQVDEMTVKATPTALRVRRAARGPR